MGAAAALLVFGLFTWSSAAAAASSVPTAKWAGSVCSAIGRWERGLRSPISVRGPLDDPHTTKATLSKQLRLAVQETGLLVKRLKAAGVPAIAHGSKIEAAVLAAFQGTAKTLASAQHQVAGLDATDPDQLATATSAIQQQEQEQITAILDTLTKVGARYRVPALDTTLQAACRAVA